MHFAKLFNFGGEALPQGQLLVEVAESTARENADAPYQLVLKTVSVYGVLMKLEYCYFEEVKRDDEFAGLTALAAEGHYRHMQSILNQATDR